MFDRNGRVRERDGYDEYTSVAAATGNYQTLFPFRYTDSTQFVLAGRNAVGATAGRVDALSNGAVLATSNSFGTSALAYSFARIGTPTAERVYVTASRNANTTPQYFNGSTSTNSAAPTCSFLGVTPADNRLVAACDTTNRSRVKFSDAGDPETFGANNYVDLDPGMASGHGHLQLARAAIRVQADEVLPGPWHSTDAGGNPIFNYTAIRSGIGCSQMGAVCAVPGRGVYFWNRDGIHLTTGGDPVKVSGPIDPLLNIGQIPSEFGAGAFYEAVATTSHVQMTWHRDRLYMTTKPTDDLGRHLRVRPRGGELVALDNRRSRLVFRRGVQRQLRTPVLPQRSRLQDHRGVHDRQRLSHHRQVPHGVL